MYANEETVQAIIDETLLRIPDKDEHKQFWKNTCIDITNFENKSIENLEPGAYIHYGALDSVYDLFPTESFSAKRNPETVAILTSCEMFVLEIDRRYKQLTYQISSGGSVEFTDFAGKIFVYNATDIDGSTGNFSRQFDFLWHSSNTKNAISWYTQNVIFRRYVNDEYVSTTFGYDSIVHKKGSSEYVYSFPEEPGTIALLENIPTKLSDLTNDSGYITIGSVGNGTLTIQKNGTTVQTFSANQSSNSTANITVPTKLSDLTNDTGYITIGSVGNGILTVTQNGTNKGTFSANQSSNSTVDITVPTKVSELTNDSGYTTNIGTVTQVKVGTTAYNPSSGVVSLPAYPTSLPASDVYAWAKASTKPSYTASEVGALALSGGTMAGTINTPANAVAINFRLGYTQYQTTVSQQTSGDEALVFASQYAQTSFIFVNGEDSITNHEPDRWQSLTPGLQIKENKVAIGKLIASGVTPTYALDVNGTVNATSFEGSGSNLTGVVHTETDPTVPSWAKASTKPSYTASEVGALALSGNATSVSTSTTFTDIRVNNIPRFENGTIDYFLGIEAFTSGGRLKWQNLPDVKTALGVPTKLSQLTNDSGYITIGSVGNGILTVTQNGASKGTFSANQSSNSTVDITVPTKVSELTNDSGYTTNIGTVTQVKVGTTAYNPSSGVVSLPAYPTSLPASDVYAWAKASTKPSYTASEVGALPLSGGTMAGTINTPANAVAINFRLGYTQYQTTVSQQTSGNEALVFASQYAQTSFIFVNGEDSITNHEPDRWQSLTPGLQIKENKVAIGKLIASGVTPTYALDVNGTVNATSFEGSGASLTGVNADTLQNSSPDESAGASTIVKRNADGRVKATYYNMSGGAEDINSFTSNVAFVSSGGWIRQTSKANFSTWLLTWTKLGSTTGNTVLTYTGTYTEFCVVLDLGFYAETFYFVASALGENRYFFGGTTNTSDGSSWVLRASRSNSTYSFKADRVHQDGTDCTSQVNVSVYAR